MSTSKLIGISLGLTLFTIVALETGQVFAHEHENGGDDNKPITSPITSPICKPGNGFGDDNHCHSGPPGQEKNHDQGNDDQGQNDNHNGDE